MTDIEIVKTILLIILGFCLLSFVISFFKKEPYNIRRAVILALIFGGLYFFLRQSGLERLSLDAIRDRFFPVRLSDYKYTKEETLRYGFPATNYIFLENLGPPLALTMSPDGKHLDITDVTVLNRVLEQLGLKKVPGGVPELSSITGKINDVNQYVWDNYQGGVLTIQRTICRDKDSLTWKHCIAIITVSMRR